MFKGIIATAMVFFIGGCGGEANHSDGSSPALEKAAASVMPPVLVQAFDVHCQETRFIRAYTGQEAILHFKIAGATLETHTIGLVAAPQSVRLSYQGIRFASSEAGSFPFHVIIRPKQACLDSGLTAEQCEGQGRHFTKVEGFDTSVEFTFLFMDQVTFDSVDTENLGQDDSLLGRVLTGQGLFGKVGQFAIDKFSGKKSDRSLFGSIFDAIFNRGDDSQPAEDDDLIGHDPFADNAPKACLNGPPGGAQ